MIRTESQWFVPSFKEIRGGVLKSTMGQADKETNDMEDAAMFFANVFGGERFKDYVCPFIPLGLVHQLSQYMLDWGNFSDERNDFCSADSGD